MSDNVTTIEFAGLTRADEHTMHDDVKAKYGGDNIDAELSLSEAIQHLDPVEVADLYVENPYSGELVGIEMANATINPDMAIERAQTSEENGNRSATGGDDMTFAVHSEGYAAVSHYDFFFPMAKALREAEVHNVAGQFRVYDNGAQVHGEVVFQDPDTQLNMEDSDDPLFVGTSVGNSYDGTCAMYAMGYAMDTFCNNSMRNLTDKRSRKHVGEPGETAEWWEEILTEMTALRDILGEVIENSLEVEVDFIYQPFSVEEFYELLGLPGYLARAAAVSARNRSPREGGTRSTINFWTLHSGLTSALSHDFNGSSEVGSLETYSRIAKDILYNPANIIHRVKDEYQREQRRDDEEDEFTEEAEENIAAIEQFETDLDDRKTEFKQFEEQVEDLLMVVEE